MYIFKVLKDLVVYWCPFQKQIFGITTIFIGTNGSHIICTGGLFSRF